MADRAAIDGDAGWQPAERYSHVRILCLDAEGSLLLLRIRDPSDGHDVFEPPGGAVQPGESILQAAARELREWTGIDVLLRDSYAVVHRDDVWDGERRVRDEAFLFAAIGDAEVRPERGEAGEAGTLVEWRFVRPGDVDQLDAPVHPADPFAVLAGLLAG